MVFIKNSQTESNNIKQMSDYIFLIKLLDDRKLKKQTTEVNVCTLFYSQMFSPLYPLGVQLGTLHVRFLGVP